VLGSTHGVMLYEEDVMRVAAALAEIPLHEGDELRRAIGAARTDAERAALERGFAQCARRAGIDEATAHAVWRELARFAAYSFCKAHAAGYGTLAYQCAYLKTHFPAEFAVGILNHHAGMYATWVHVEDLRRQGVRFLAPCVQRSAWDATIERSSSAFEESQDLNADSVRALNGGSVAWVPSSAVPGLAGAEAAWVPSPRFESSAGARDGGATTRVSAGPQERAGTADEGTHATQPPFNADRGTVRVSAAVRIGLSRVFGLAETTGARILRARARRPFASLADLTDRARPTLPELEALILAGALDWTQRSRPSLLLEARTAAATTAPRPSAVATLVDPGGAEILPEPRAPIAVPALPEFTVAERVRGERSACGLWFSGHPLDAIDEPAQRGVLPACEIERHVGERAAVLGLPCAWRRVATKSGGDMLFMTLADRTGLVECVLFPDAFRANIGALRGEVVRAEGRVEETLGAATLTVARASSVSPS
jgi:DNA polymerase III alpha subunit